MEDPIDHFVVEFGEDDDCDSDNDGRGGEETN